MEKITFLLLHICGKFIDEMEGLKSSEPYFVRQFAEFSKLFFIVFTLIITYDMMNIQIIIIIIIV